jgi:hypothetical protein
MMKIQAQKPPKLSCLIAGIASRAPTPSLGVSGLNLEFTKNVKEWKGVRLEMR